MNSEQQQKFFPQLRNDRAAVEATFGPKSSAALAARIQREDPQLYQSLKADARTLGLISSGETPAEPSAFGGKLFQGGQPRQQAPTMSDVELEARGRFSKDQCRELFLGDGRSAAKLHETDPQSYKLAQIAAASHGLLNSNLIPTRPTVTADHVGLTPSLAQKTGLPADLKVSLDQLDKLVQGIAMVELAKQGKS